MPPVRNHIRTVSRVALMIRCRIQPGAAPDCPNRYPYRVVFTFTAAHTDMMVLMLLLMAEIKEKLLVIFDDIEVAV